MRERGRTGEQNWKERTGKIMLEMRGVRTEGEREGEGDCWRGREREEKGKWREREREGGRG